MAIHCSGASGSACSMAEEAMAKLGSFLTTFAWRADLRSLAILLLRLFPAGLLSP
jgi:hypothetical protein